MLNLTALFTGIRGHELFQIYWRDVDLEKRTIKLRAQITKNGKPRTIPLIVPLAIFLKAYHDRGRDYLPYYEGGREQRSNERVFPLNASAKVQEWVRMCGRAGIPAARKGGFGFHALRHTAVTSLIRVLSLYDLEYIQNGSASNRYKHYPLCDIDRMKELLDKDYWGNEPILPDQDTLDWYSVNTIALLTDDKGKSKVERELDLLDLTTFNPHFSYEEQEKMLAARNVLNSMISWLQKVGDLTEEQAVKILCQ